MRSSGIRSLTGIHLPGTVATLCTELRAEVSCGAAASMAARQRFHHYRRWLRVAIEKHISHLFALRRPHIGISTT
ncbi:Uncharacterised protein [Klebsiella pneumoniae]|uniref:Uncharacterized protein n=1 Tax=Klebsiella pneumoniae TaxID=573 RepID=A0A378F309_KLEPN|nr:Uncharacterised protein [Klebsiella pneumoniae]